MSVLPIRRQLLSSPGQLIDALQIPFSSEQLDAITAPLEPAVIIAGAGSGKTTVMAARVVWLVGTGQVRPEEVLGLTFTRKAAAELGSRVAAALDRAGVLTGLDGEGAELVMTYDSFAARLVSEFGLRIGIDRDPVMVTGASRFRLATRVVANAPGPFRSISRLSHHSIPERVLALDAEMQSHLVSAEAVLQECARAERRFAEAPLYRGRTMRDVEKALDATEERRELLQLVEDYQELKQRLGVVEFADQLREAVRLVTRVPAVGQEMRRRFKVVLLDEYQDTSSAQARLLRELFTGAPSSDAMGFPVTAVGDPYQAIYGWRGAASGNILEFPMQFRRGDGTPAARYTLSVNRRSGQRILDVGNALARDLAAAPGEEGVSLLAPEGAPAGMVAAATFDTFRDEVDWIAESVIARHETGTGWAELAILVRRNALLAPLFEALRERDVPVEIVGLGGLLALPEVAPIVATLRVIDDVTDNPAVATLLSGPRWQIGLADLELLGERARQLAGPSAQPTAMDEALLHAVTQADPGEVVCLLDAVADPGELPFSPEARERLLRFHREIAGLRRHAAEPVADLVTRVIAVLGLEAELIASGAETSQVARFVAEVAEYTDVDGDGTLTGLLAYLDAEEDFGEGLQQAVPTEADSVKLLTVHRAKGLEWDTVFLPSLVDQVFPSEPRSGIWPTRAETLPATLRGDSSSIPQLREFSKNGLAAYRDASRADHRLAEDRLPTWRSPGRSGCWWPPATCGPPETSGPEPSRPTSRYSARRRHQRSATWTKPRVVRTPTRCRPCPPARRGRRRWTPTRWPRAPRRHSWSPRPPRWWTVGPRNAPSGSGSPEPSPPTRRHASPPGTTAPGTWPRWSAAARTGRWPSRKVCRPRPSCRCAGTRPSSPPRCCGGCHGPPRRPPGWGTGSTRGCRNASSSRPPSTRRRPRRPPTRPNWARSSPRSRPGASPLSRPWAWRSPS